MSEEVAFSKAEILLRIDRTWQDFQAYLKTLDEQQLTTPTDAAGWTAKDHIMHLAVWEQGMLALLNKESRHGAMGLDDATWTSGDYDRMNAVIQQRHADKSLAEVLNVFNDTHARLVAKIEAMSEEDLQKPYRDYQPGADRSEGVWNWIEGNTYEHYPEHQEWIGALIGG